MYCVFVKGLEQCVHLEELILNDNLVKKIEGLAFVCVCLSTCMCVYQLDCKEIE